MTIIVGLGNPGKKYEQTRHNAGFLALDMLARHWQCDEWRQDKKSGSLLAECARPGLKQPILLVKPQTFMNNSGATIKSLAMFYKLQSANFTVIHDDIDIPLGEVKVSQGSGSAGHKGVESIIQHLGTKEFTRMRVGILPESGKPENVEQFVLKDFTKKELPLLEEALRRCADLLNL